MIHFLSVFFILQMKELRPRMMEMMRYLFQSHRSNKKTKRKKKARTQNSRILYPNSSTTTSHLRLGTFLPFREMASFQVAHYPQTDASSNGWNLIRTGQEWHSRHCLLETRFSGGGGSPDSFSCIPGFQHLISPDQMGH